MDEFREHPAKRLRSSSDGLTKIGFLVETFRENKLIQPDRGEFQIFVVDDLNLKLSEYHEENHDHDYKFITPKIRIDGKISNWAGCVLNSTLYMFSGYVNVRNEFEDDDDDDVEYEEEIIRERGCRKYAFEEEDLRRVGCVKKLDLADLDVIASMNYPKILPRAIPTPDGEKILVIQYFIDPRWPERAIELFDPSTESWTHFTQGFPIGNRPYMIANSITIKIWYYTFLDNSTFVVNTSHGDLVLNLKDKVWRSLSELPFPPYAMGIHNDFCVVTIDRRYLVGWDTVFDISAEANLDEEAITVIPLPLSTREKVVRPLDCCHFMSRPSMALVDRKDDQKLYHTCFIEPEKWGRPHLIMDAYSIDLNNLKTGLTDSRKFRLDSEMEDLLIQSVSLFTI